MLSFGEVRPQAQRIKISSWLKGPKAEGMASRAVADGRLAAAVSAAGGVVTIAPADNTKGRNQPNI